MSENKIIIQGKEIDYGEMNENQLVQLFTELKQRELMLYEKAKELESQIKLIEDAK